MDEHFPFSLPPLSWSGDGPDPAGQKALALHHDDCFAADVDALNRLLAGYPFYQSWPLSKLCLNWSELPDTIRQGVRNSAGGVYGHGLYFRNLRFGPVSSPEPPLSGAIDRCFGDLPHLRGAMRHAALSQCGSGWVWLCVTPEGNLSVVRTCNQDTPLPLRPLLCCDLWEHAYYPRHRTRRGEYFDSWWLLIDWPQVSKAMESTLAGRPPYPLP